MVAFNGVMIDSMSRGEMLELRKRDYTKCVKNPDGYRFVEGAYYLLEQEDDGRYVSACDGERLFFMQFIPVNIVEQYFSNDT